MRPLSFGSGSATAGSSFEIADDGAGFDPDSARGSGSGYTNMTDRMASLGGTLTVDTAPGQGTTVRGSLPVATLIAPIGGRHEL